MKLSSAVTLMVLVFCFPEIDLGAQTVTVGSKKFTENVILGEIAVLTAESMGLSAEYRRELGGTRILWNALVRGDIDIYPEYTGTIVEEILHSLDLPDDSDLQEVLSRYGIGCTHSLGFNNTYAIGMLRTIAERLEIHTISDLRRYPELKIGFTNEFLDRRDGWPGLKQRYRLPQRYVRGLDHDLAYRGLVEGSIEVVDMYSTDAEILQYGLVSLEDDLNYFPTYDAVMLYRLDIDDSAPGLREKLESLSGAIQAADMIAMNSKAKIDRIDETQIAAEFLQKRMDMPVDGRSNRLETRLVRTTLEHLALVGISLTLAILAAVPLGIVAAKKTRAGKLILGFTGLIQTVPSLALLVFMIPLFGIGSTPAVIALFLYSLLPIVRNTHSGLLDIPLPIRESAVALGLPAATRLVRIELPLALRSILTGIKTSAVINVGTATLGALIGAGGYGQTILTGIRLDDTRLILEGAVPAALLALVVQGVFDLIEHSVLPKGLRSGLKKSADT